MEFRKTRVIKIHFDGGFEKEQVSYAIAVYHNDQLIDEQAIKVQKPGLSSNIAEYYGINLALSWVLHNYEEYPDTKFEIIGDSQLIIYQVLGEYKTKNTNLLPLNQLAQSILNVLSKKVNVNIRWVPRSLNEKADRACRNL